MARFGLRVGVVILPESPWSRARDRWVRAEALGFDHAWTYDHLTWRGHRDAPWFAAMPTLTAAALVTTQIRLGLLVASPNFRHPLPFAKELIALDDISSGRVTAGIGAGGTGWDATMLGQEPWTARERGRRFEEFVELTDRLLRQPTMTYRGQFWVVDEARTYPGCVQQPRIPFAIAATGPRGMRLAARHGQTWVTTGPRDSDAVPSLDQSVNAVAAQIDQLAEACADTERDFSTIDRLLLTAVPLDSGLSSVDAFTETAARYAAVGITDLVVHWPRTSEPYRNDLPTFERIFSA
jgi:alkanesulfonate monooxygenase SsuD/methylene tetrahydromethanopterin reductase-like flavin-dependent oxidoreductase (luciferase family)